MFPTDMLGLARAAGICVDDVLDQVKKNKEYCFVDNESSTDISFLEVVALIICSIMMS